MIELEPISNSSVRLLSGIGVKPAPFLFSDSTKQLIVFSVKFARRGHRVVRLATGETLEDIDGHVRLHRGITYSEEGKRIVDEFRYNPPSAGDEDNPASSASFSVTLFVEERLFDQIVDLSHTIGLPTIDLQFDYQKGTVVFGDAPDGSEVLWNNTPKLWEEIEGATFAHLLLQNVSRSAGTNGSPLNIKSRQPADD